VTAEVYYEISHNLIQEEMFNGEKRLVHRKGATRAFAAGHSSLARTRWESGGHPILIPGSMYTGGAILKPGPCAFKTAFSVNHGSGRVMGRKDAKRRLDGKQQDINNEMSSVQRSFGGVQIEGILSNHRNVPVDESTRVYKDLDAVLDALTSEGIATVEHRLWPVANVKGGD
jgi:tRNA-splicing ligase RtcB